MSTFPAGWSYYIFDWQSGQILCQLPTVQLTWSMEIGGSKIQGAIDKKSIQRQSLIFPWGAFPVDLDIVDLLMPGKRGFCAMFDGTPMVGGIIGDRDDDFDGTSFPVSGIVDWFDGLTMVLPTSTWRNDVYQWQGFSWGTIGKRVVQQALSKPGAGIPILYDPDETTGGLNGHDSAYHTKTYNGFDVANLSVASVLDKLSNLDGGPDFDFRLQFQEGSKSKLCWYMRFGTESDPNIHQDGAPLIFDVNSPEVESFKQTISSSYRFDRVFQIGNGQDEAEVAAIAEDDSMLQEGWPLREVVQSDTDLSSDNLALTAAKGALAPWPLTQWELTIRGDGRVKLGFVWPGDVVRFHIVDFRTLPDGWYESRVLSMSGTESVSTKLVLDSVNAVI